MNFDKKKIFEAVQTFINEQSQNINDKDIKTVLEHQDDIEKKLNQFSPLERFINDGKLFIGLVRDYAFGDYTQIPYKSIASVVTGLLYLINPLDIIPDFLPVVGHIDDALIFGLCLKLVESDLEKYRIWKHSIVPKPASEPETQP